MARLRDINSSSTKERQHIYYFLFVQELPQVRIGTKTSERVVHVLVSYMSECMF